MIIFVFCHFSVAKTSTKPPAVLKMDIRRVLDRMQLHSRETNTGFDCIELPSTNIMTSSLLDPPRTLPQKPHNIRALPAPYQIQWPPHHPGPPRNVANSRVFASVGQNTPSVRFEINIVNLKVRIFSFLRLLSHLAFILISFLGPTAVTWSSILPCGRRRIAVPGARTSSSNGAKSLIRHVIRNGL